MLGVSVVSHPGMAKSRGARKRGPKRRAGKAEHILKQGRRRLASHVGNRRLALWSAHNLQSRVVKN
jgi:hypothetical protein